MNRQRYFRDKVVLITGSARGIGREVARQALAAGAKVVLNGRNPDTLEATRQALGFPDRTVAVTADLTRPEEADALVAATLSAWSRLDVLINNAGISMRGAFSDLSNETIRVMVDANLLSAVWMTRAALPALRASRGRVLFVSSLAAVRGFPGVSLYSASKMGLTALLESLCAEEGPRGVGFGLAHLAFTENDPDKTVLGADGRAFHHDRRWTLTQTQTSGKILDAVARKRTRVVLTASGRLLVWTQAWWPGLVDKFVERSGGKIHYVEAKRP